MLGIQFEDYKKVATIFFFFFSLLSICLFFLFNCHFLRLSYNLRMNLFLVTLGHISDISRKEAFDQLPTLSEAHRHINYITAVTLIISQLHDISSRSLSLCMINSWSGLDQINCPTKTTMYVRINFFIYFLSAIKCS
jgi:hypothetical protein